MDQQSTNRIAMRLIPVALGLMAIGFMAIKGCQEGPFGRKQIVALQPAQEAQLGAQAYQQVLQQAEVIQSGPTVAAVRDITDRLTKATDNEEFLRLTGLKRQNFKWEVRVVRSKEVNAFCLPGGKIVVYTAILPIAETNAGLATVMGHEIAHALGHHGAERMAQKQMVQIGMTAAATSLNDLDPTQRDGVMQALNTGAKFGILKYSRNHESEADHMGLLLMAAAGYDPEEAVKFWGRMAQLGKSRNPEFLSTHPSHDTRINDLKKWMSAAMPLYRASKSPVETKRLPLPGR